MPGRQICNLQSRLSRSRTRLLRNGLGAPVDTLEQRRLHRAQPEQVVPAVVSRTQHNIGLRLQQLERALDKRCRHIRAIASDQHDRTMALQELREGAAQALTERISLLRNQRKGRRQLLEVAPCFLSRWRIAQRVSDSGDRHRQRERVVQGASVHFSCLIITEHLGNSCLDSAAFRLLRYYYQTRIHAAMNVIMIPSATGGLGHIGRTAALARAIARLKPDANIEYLLDTEKLRPFNVDAAAAMGYSVNFLPERTRTNREAIIRACLAHADVIVEDTCRTLIPYRKIVPHAAWMSVPMYPLGDELFLDWPMLHQVDAIAWAYPPALEFPAELAALKSKVIKAGPFFEIDDIPGKRTARARLGFSAEEKIVLYSPRGMSFGREFGEQVLAAVIGAIRNLRRKQPVRLVLTAVNDRKELRAPGVPDPLPKWVSVVPTLASRQMLTYLRAVDVAITEGSNATQEACALGTPILMVPGTIHETWLLGRHLQAVNGAEVVWIETVDTPTLTNKIGTLLNDQKLRKTLTASARQVVNGGLGVDAAARWVINAARRRTTARQA